MPFPAKTTFTLDWTTVPDVPTPGTYTAAQLKSMFNQRDQELLDFVNSILAVLTAVTPGSSGADNIASAPITGVAGSAVYAQLVDLKNQLNGVVLGQIPDASLDYVKLNAATKDLLTENGIVRQAIINSNFDVWQRGTSFSSPAYNTYTADRFFETGDGTVGTFTISRQAFTPGQTAVPNNPKYFYRHDQTVAGTGQTFRNFSQKIENGSLFAGSTFTMSFYAKADSARTVSCSVFRNYGTGGSPTSAEQLGVNNAIALTTSWQKFTLVVTASSVSGKTFGTNGDDYNLLVVTLPFNTTFTIDIAQVQINSGNIALPFPAKSFANELLDCQKYYEPLDFNAISSLVRSGTNSVLCKYPFKVKKRVSPTLANASDLSTTLGNGSKQISLLRISDNAVITATGNVTVVPDNSTYMTPTIGSVSFSAATSFSGTAGDVLYINQTTKDTLIGFDAEL